MPQSLSRVILHIVFSTKNRQASIPEEVRLDLHAYIAGVCRGVGCDAYRVGGTSNHVHIACTLPRTLSVSKLLEETKKTSSAWMKSRDPRCGEFAWQAGYAAFSAGQEGLGTVIEYIDKQQEHHSDTSFETEFVALCKRHGVEFDTRYVWD